jgi:peptidoglycan/xylan/chitin deacetylase (PgdA/CDA1 family)
VQFSWKDGARWRRQMAANVLLIVDKEDASLLNIPKQNENWNIYSVVMDYRQLRKRVAELKKIITEKNIDFVLYSRNDQVGNRISIGPFSKYLRIGYSSFSGIDEKSRIKQMQICFEDFLNCNLKLNLEQPKKKRKLLARNYGSWTFSLIFDTEQIGCARYGVPRILRLLERYDVKATFFATNLIKRVYPDILSVINTFGHEIGLHGLWHEYLSDSIEEIQVKLLRYMISDFDCEISGANFIGRMNTNTIRALIQNRMRYFVYASLNHYYRTNYLKYPTTPNLVHLENGTIWMMPISVETYGAHWFSIKNMIDSVMNQNNQFHHISILCHPFRDGNLVNIRTLEKLIWYLINKNVKSVRLGEIVNALSCGECLHGLVDENSLRDALILEQSKLTFPHTRQDLMGMVPENMIALYRRIRERALG